VRGAKDFYISHEPHGLVIRYRGFIFVWFAARAQAKAFALLVCRTAALMRAARFAVGCKNVALMWATACYVCSSTRLRVRMLAVACGVLTLPPLNAARLFAGFVGNLFFRDKEEDFCS
jgi:hypothetical protein